MLNEENTSKTNETVSSGNGKDYKELLVKLQTGLYEKDEAIRLALLCAISGESIFFMGPPGTAKSMISRRIKEAFSGNVTYFEYLMNEFSTPDEICGPVSLKELSDNDKYERKTDGFLPKANIAFLDEIWKSGPAILNTLLTIINEKIFHNGSSIEKVPLQSLIAASNEFPAKNRGLEALWDRFVVRVMVNPVKDEDSFFQLCESSQEKIDIPNNLKLNFNKIDIFNKSKIEKIELSQNIKDVITAIRKELVVKNGDGRTDEEKYYISDRRWKKIVHLLKTSAFLNYRQSIDLMDCQLIRYCIWGTQKQYTEAKNIVEEIVKQHGLGCTTDIEDINDRIEEFDKYITETFYDFVPSEVITYRMSNNRIAYKIKDPQKQKIGRNDVEVCFISVGNASLYYDQNKQAIDTCYSGYPIDTKINNNNISFKDQKTGTEYTLEIEMTKSRLVKKDSVFSNINVLKPVQDDANKTYFFPISEQIKTTLENLKAFQDKCEEPFSKNLFVEQSFKRIIMNKIDDARKELEEADVSLKKEQSWYIE